MFTQKIKVKFFGENALSIIKKGDWIDLTSRKDYNLNRNILKIITKILAQ